MRHILILLALVANWLPCAPAPEVAAPDTYTYMTGCGFEALIDVYEPVGPPNGACALFVHGGGFVGGHRGLSLVQPLAEQLTAEGWYVASCEYRLPAVCVDAPRDVAQAIAWLKRSLPIDPARIGIVGFSAGSTLAAMAVATPWYYIAPDPVGPHDFTDSERTVAAIYTCAPPVDFSMEFPPDVWANNIEVYLNGDYLEVHSPIVHIGPETPPWGHAHGTDDTVIPMNQSICLGTKLAQWAVPGAATYGPWRHTCWREPEVQAAIFDFLTEHVLP